MSPASEPPPSSDPSSARDGEVARAPSLLPPPGLRDMLGEACGLALASCLLGSVPAALRVARAGGSLVGGLLAAAAIVLPPIALAISLSRAAGRGFRMVTGIRAGRSTVAGIAIWVGLMAPVLLLLGALLKEKTNHRGLGGTTFGVLALIVAVGCAAVAHRVMRTGRWLVDRGLSPSAVATGFAVLAVGPLLLVSLPLMRGHDDSPHAPAVAAALIDGLIFTVAAAVAVTFEIGARARDAARRFGAPVAGGLLAIGLFWLSVSPPLGVALRSGGGLAAALIGGLERWTDRDGDGFGAHFGGQDCDEGDPRRYPGAADPTDDGVDQDCDGVDGVRPSARALAQQPPPRGDELVPTAVAAGSDAPAAAAGPGGKPPSIVLVTLDTVRFDRTSAYGYARATTPRLTALAQKGALFEVAYAPASDTPRALLPLFSAATYGDTPKRIVRDWPSLRSEADTLAERVKAAGYRTAFVSSFQWLSKERGFEQGFDHFIEVFREEHPERGVTGTLAIRSARAIVDEAKDDPKPLFLWVHLFDAHEQYRRHEGFDFGRGDERAYDSEIAFVDKQLGELVDAVGASPRGQDVAWIVHGSQGEAFKEHGASGHGSTLYEEMVRVPLVVSLPGSRAALRVAGRAVSTLDIVPTVLQLAGADAGALGVSLLPAARGGDAARKPVIMRGVKRSAVVDWPLKLIVIERGARDRLLLFDLSTDPGEKSDLSASRKDDVTRLHALLRP